jgi:hypothetical protein
MDMTQRSRSSVERILSPRAPRRRQDASLAPTRTPTAAAACLEVSASAARLARTDRARGEIEKLEPSFNCLDATPMRVRMLRG